MNNVILGVNMFALRQLVLTVTLGLCVTTGVFAFHAPAHALDISTEYNDIRTKGLIFANICDSAKPDPATNIADSCECRSQGKCTIDHVVQVFVNVSYLILALSGSAALIALVYGGLEWVISAGNADRIKRGKDSLAGAAIGLVIVFGAYVFINLLIGVLTNGEAPSTPIEDTLGNGADTRINTE